ncbi:transposase [Streptomyces sp. NPDC017966]|uniref:DesA/ISL3 alpha bundle tail domain-containing protein n=1 Tax=unclassified Streptomyces TaxID=2593676 RepID=UPI001C2153AA|nr:transposase [Streptomyces sp. AC558_RSS880]
MGAALGVAFCGVSPPLRSCNHIAATCGYASASDTPNERATAPHLTVRRVTDWIMRRPEHLTETDRTCLDELCERSPALTTTTEYVRRLAAMVRERRSEHLALDVWLADVRLDGQRELRTLTAGIRRDRTAVLAALTTTSPRERSRATSPESSC